MGVSTKNTPAYDTLFAPPGLWFLIARLIFLRHLPVGEGAKCPCVAKTFSGNWAVRCETGAVIRDLAEDSRQPRTTQARVADEDDTEAHGCFHFHRTRGWRQGRPLPPQHPRQGPEACCVYWVADLAIKTQPPSDLRWGAKKRTCTPESPREPAGTN